MAFSNTEQNARSERRKNADVLFFEIALFCLWCACKRLQGIHNAKSTWIRSFWIYDCVWDWLSLLAIEQWARIETKYPSVFAVDETEKKVYARCPFCCAHVIKSHRFNEFLFFFAFYSLDSASVPSRKPQMFLANASAHRDIIFHEWNGSNNRNWFLLLHALKTRDMHWC